MINLNTSIIHDLTHNITHDTLPLLILWMSLNKWSMTAKSILM